MKNFANIIFAAILSIVLLWGVIKSLTNKSIDISEVDELIFVIKGHQNALIDNESVAQLSNWKLQLIDLKNSIEAGEQSMSRKEFLQLCDSIDGYVPVKMSDEEKEKLQLDFKRAEDEIDNSVQITDTIIGQMTSEKFEEMFGCKPDPELL